MTNREFFVAVVNANISDELTAHAQAAIEKLDKALDARKNKPNKKDEENAPVLEALTNALTSEKQTAPDLAAAVGVSTQKASALLRKLVDAGVAVAEDVNVPKKGKMKGYALAVDETKVEVEDAE